MPQSVKVHTSSLERVWTRADGRALRGTVGTATYRSPGDGLRWALRSPDQALMQKAVALPALCSRKGSCASHGALPNTRACPGSKTRTANGPTVPRLFSPQNTSGITVLHLRRNSGKRARVKTCVPRDLRCQRFRDYVTRSVRPMNTLHFTPVTPGWVEAWLPPTCLPGLSWAGSGCDGSPNWAAMLPSSAGL